MEAETLPRWNLPPVDFIETDGYSVESAIIRKYEETAGRVLADGDPVRLFLQTIAAVIIWQRTAINLAAKQNLLSYAQGEYLDALGHYLNVTRLPGSKAVTTLRFSLSQALGNPYTIVAGFAVTNGIITFITDEDLTIPAGELTGTVTATCTTQGIQGNNYLAGQINTIVNPMTFLETAVNITSTAGGSDVETDQAFAQRIRLAPNAFSVAGPTKAYQYHTYSVSSAIIDVSVITPQAGYVNVYPLLEGGTLPSSDVLNEINEHLSADDIRPLTDFVQVLAPKVHHYTINVDWWVSVENQGSAVSIMASVADAVEKYRQWQQAKIGRDISPEKLITMIVNAGASRINRETLLPCDFVEIGSDTVAQCDSVTVAYQGVKDE